MRISTFLLIIASFLILVSSCVRNSRKSNKEKLKDSLLKELQNSVYNEYTNNPKDSIDFSKIEISEDSLDLALFNLILEHEDYSDNKLIENITILTEKGADLNAVVEYQYSVRKLGTYIPIVKHFYRNKYRTYSDNSTAFHEAVNSSKLKVVKKMIELGADVNAPSKNGVFPVDLAVKNDQLQMLKLLKENKCDIKVANIALTHNIQTIEWLSENGADTKNINVNFALSDPVLLKRILKLKPDLSKHELDYQIIFSNEVILDMLLEAGLNDKARGKFPSECPPIYGAIKYGDVNSVKKLKEAGLNIHIKCEAGFDNSPFLLVVSSGNKEMLEYYLNIEKANPNQTDWTKKSALILAVNTDDNEIIEMLIDAGANIEYTAYFNKTPLMHAVQYNHYIGAQTLISAGANLNYANKYNETALVLAVKESNFPMIKLLVENGANVKKKYKSLSLSQYAGSINASNMIIKYLEEHEK
jgi:ankyrin repeat protein